MREWGGEKGFFFNEDDSLQLQSQNKSNFVFRYGTSLELVYEITTSLTKYRERDAGEPSLLLLLLAMLLVTRLWLYYTYRVYNTVYFSARQRQQQLYSNSIKGLLSCQDLEYFYRMSSARYMRDDVLFASYISNFPYIWHKRNGSLRSCQIKRSLWRPPGFRADFYFFFLLQNRSLLKISVAESTESTRDCCRVQPCSHVAKYWRKRNWFLF